MTQQLMNDEDLRKEHSFLLQKYLHAVMNSSGNTEQQAERIINAENEFVSLIKQQQQAYGDSREMLIWQNIKSSVECTNDNTQRLMRFHLPDFNKRIESLQTKNNKETK